MNEPKHEHAGGVWTLEDRGQRTVLGILHCRWYCTYPGCTVVTLTPA